MAPIRRLNNTDIISTRRFQKAFDFVSRYIHYVVHNTSQLALYFEDIVQIEKQLFKHNINVDITMLIRVRLMLNDDAKDAMEAASSQGEQY